MEFPEKSLRFSSLARGASGRLKTVISEKTAVFSENTPVMWREHPCHQIQHPRDLRRTPLLCGENTPVISTNTAVKWREHTGNLSPTPLS